MTTRTEPGSGLEVRDLRIAYGDRTVVQDVSFEIPAGGSLALVGASGSGKSQTALAIPGLLPRAASVSGSVRFEGEDLLRPGAAAAVRGSRIAMVFQDALGSLAPHLRIGTQLAEPLLLHRGMTRDAARAECLRLMDAVGIADARERLRQYPHQLSGGQRQRVQIAMALAGGPSLLIADEPTTALDVTVQAQILHLLASLRSSLKLGLLLVSHDLAVVAGLCERAAVMHDGRLVEIAPVGRLIAAPQHRHTRALLAARRALDAA